VDNTGRIASGKAHDRIVADLLEYGGERIKDINARTLQQLTAEIAEGTRRGYSITQLVEGVADEGFAGIKNLSFDNGLTVFGDLRAETIARTETALSYNRSSLLGYKEFAVRYVEAIDGHGDPDCQDRDGKRFEVDEALTTVDHPNGTLDWIPVTGKSWDEPSQPVVNVTVQNNLPGQAPDVKVYNDVATPALNIPPTEVNVTTPEVKVYNDVTVPEQAAPIVNVTTPDVTVNTPDVHVTSPEIHVAPAEVKVENTYTLPEQPAPVVNVTTPAQKAASGPLEMRIVSMPDRVTKRKVDRNKQGQITDTTDVEVDG
jgi:hypothetical protein